MSDVDALLREMLFVVIANNDVPRINILRGSEKQLRGKKTSRGRGLRFSYPYRLWRKSTLSDISLIYGNRLSKMGKQIF